MNTVAGLLRRGIDVRGLLPRDRARLVGRQAREPALTNHRADPDTLWASAYHEAGHMVAQVVLGGRAARLSLHADAGGFAEGSTLVNNRAECLVDAAGSAAQALYVESTTWPDQRMRSLPPRTEGDRADYAAHSGLSGLALDDAWAADFMAALDLLRQHWRAVKALATALFHKGELSAGTVDSI